MTDEQIETISREYAESRYPVAKTYDDDHLRAIAAAEMRETLRRLSKRYYIVAKEVVANKYNDCKIGAEMCDSLECGFMADLLEDLFPELLKDKEE